MTSKVVDFFWQGWSGNVHQMKNTLVDSKVLMCAPLIAHTHTDTHQSIKEGVQSNVWKS